MIPTKQYGTDFALHDFHFITEDLWKGAPYLQMFLSRSGIQTLS